MKGCRANRQMIVTTEVTIYLSIAIFLINVVFPAIRVAAKWYAQHLLGIAQIILLTNDVGCLTKAKSEEIESMTSNPSLSVTGPKYSSFYNNIVHDYVRQNLKDFPELVDILVEPGVPHSEDDEGVRTGKFIYPDVRYTTLSPTHHMRQHGSPPIQHSTRVRWTWRKA